jgi:penicillin-binding protein 2
MYLRNPQVRVGKSGVEAALEDQLHGQAGWRKVIVNARGVEMGEDEHERREPIKGSGAVLTIDAELQRIAMQSFGDQAGGCVVMDIYTGDILVMASAPSFDPNLFVNGIGQTDFAALNGDEKKPLFNKAVSGAYPPGSTFKTMVGIAAKQAGVDDDWHVNCPGYFNYGGRAFHCWRPGGHGAVNLHRAIRESCDVYFYNAALRAGPERIAAVAREFGLGTAHNVSVPHVNAGLIPDPTWWREHRHENWTGGLTVNYGIGQGAMSATPLQLCVQAARIANNGKAVVPRLVREGPGVTDPGQPPTMAGIAPEHLAQIRGGMFGVCNEPGGTATRAGTVINLSRTPDGRIVDRSVAPAGSTPIQIAGKTGTSQVRIITAAERSRGVISNANLPWALRDNALFISWGPYDNPRYACAVVIEHGGHTNPEFDAPMVTARTLRECFLRDPANRPPARLAQLEPTAPTRGSA